MTRAAKGLVRLVAHLIDRFWLTHQAHIKGGRRGEPKDRGATTGSKHAYVINVDDFNSTEDSDGKSMLRAVEKKEHARDYSGRRSPDRQTRKHWHNPTPVVKPGKEPNRWQFRCRYCKAYVSFACSILM